MARQTDASCVQVSGRKFAPEAEVASVIRALGLPRGSSCKCIATGIEYLDSQKVPAGEYIVVFPGAAPGSPESPIRKGLELLGQIAEQVGTAFRRLQIQPHQTRSMKMSSVGSTAAVSLVEGLGITIVNGNKRYPLGSPRTSLVGVEPFPMSNYSSEPLATPEYITYVEAQLRSAGVVIGAGGWDVLDVHKQKDLLAITLNGCMYKGFLDGAIVPFGVASVLQQLRLGIELKQSAADRAEWRKNNLGNKPNRACLSDEEDGEVEDDDQEGEREDAPQLKWSGRDKGQVLLEMLAACTVAEHPFDMLLTNSHAYHIVRVRGRQLIHWTNLDQATAMEHVVEWLQEADPDMTFRLETSSRPAEQMEPLHLLRGVQRATDAAFAGTSAVMEQADALMAITPPDERLKVALELVHTWNVAEGGGTLAELHELPDAIKAWYI